MVVCGAYIQLDPSASGVAWNLQNLWTSYHVVEQLTTQGVGRLAVTDRATVAREMLRHVAAPNAPVGHGARTRGWAMACVAAPLLEYFGCVEGGHGDEAQLWSDVALRLEGCIRLGALVAPTGKGLKALAADIPVPPQARSRWPRGHPFVTASADEIVDLVRTQVVARWDQVEAALPAAMCAHARRPAAVTQFVAAWVMSPPEDQLWPGYVTASPGRSVLEASSHHADIAQLLTFSWLNPARPASRAAVTHALARAVLVTLGVIDEEAPKWVKGVKLCYEWCSGGAVMDVEHHNGFRVTLSDPVAPHRPHVAACLRMRAQVEGVHGGARVLAAVEDFLSQLASVPEELVRGTKAPYYLAGADVHVPAH